MAEQGREVEDICLVLVECTLCVIEWLVVLIVVVQRIHVHFDKSSCRRQIPPQATINLARRVNTRFILLTSTRRLLTSHGQMLDMPLSE